MSSDYFRHCCFIYQIDLFCLVWLFKWLGRFRAFCRFRTLCWSQVLISGSKEMWKRRGGVLVGRSWRKTRIAGTGWTSICDRLAGNAWRPPHSDRQVMLMLVSASNGVTGFWMVLASRDGQCSYHNWAPCWFRRRWWKITEPSRCRQEFHGRGFVQVWRWVIQQRLKIDFAVKLKRLAEIAEVEEAVLASVVEASAVAKASVVVEVVAEESVVDEACVGRVVGVESVLEFFQFLAKKKIVKKVRSAVTQNGFFYWYFIAKEFFT